MKTVFSNRELCHVFISQDQEHGRNPSESLYFSQDEIFSYGSHHLLGKIFESKKLLLVNQEGYSSTTCQHRSNLISAASHLKVLLVPYPNPSNIYCHEDNLKYIENRIIETFESILRARKIWGHYNIEAHYIAIENYNFYLKAFNLPNEPIETDSQHLRLLMQFNIETKKKMKINDSLKEERRQKRLDKLRELAPEAIEKWSNREELSQDQKDSIKGLTLLRVQDDSVKTSRGASVPLKQAIYFYRKLKESGDITGDKIGHFTVNRIENQTLKIGCHDIEIKEADRVLSKYLKIIESVRCNVGHFSPNEIANHSFEDMGIKLTSHEVVAISDLL